jgi:hypothetical protein
MSEPFDRLWEGRSEWTPALLLNATWVEDRQADHREQHARRRRRRREDFVDVEDANRFFAPRSISLSTAAHMSARFTYVSPAGSLREEDGKTYGAWSTAATSRTPAPPPRSRSSQTIDQLAEDEPRWEPGGALRHPHQQRARSIRSTRRQPGA